MQIQWKGAMPADLLVNIFTKERQEVNVYNRNFGMYGWGWGWGWNPMMGWNQTSVSNSTRGTLFIDLIDAQKKELVWQGVGHGYLSTNMERKASFFIAFATSFSVSKAKPTRTWFFFFSPKEDNTSSVFSSSKVSDDAFFFILEVAGNFGL